MPSHERRSATRKSYAIPVRFNVITEQYAMVGAASAGSRSEERRVGKECRP